MWHAQEGPESQVNEVIACMRGTKEAVVCLRVTRVQDIAWLRGIREAVACLRGTRVQVSEVIACLRGTREAACKGPKSK